MAYGVKRSSAPRLAPSSLNWTPAMPTLSAAVALRVMVRRTVEPEAGAVMVTVGGLLSTLTVTGAEVVRLPAPSRATAVRVWEPLAVAVVSQEIVYGVK